MANCVCGSWIHNPTFTDDAKYDALCSNCKLDLGYQLPLSKEELKLLQQRKQRLYELQEKYDQIIDEYYDI